MAVEIGPELKQAIESALRRGDRIELIPVKDGVKAVRVKRDELNKKPHP